MSDAQEKEPSHPLEQVTGEKDVPPEEEGARSQSTEDDGSAGAEDTSAE